MSEQKQSYWAQLDEWTEKVIVDRLFGAWQDYSQASNPKSGFSEAEAEEVLKSALAEVQKAVRDKALESYRNGQAAGPARKPFRPQKQK